MFLTETASLVVFLGLGLFLLKPDVPGPETENLVHFRVSISVGLRALLLLGLGPSLLELALFRFTGVLILFGLALPFLFSVLGLFGLTEVFLVGLGVSVSVVEPDPLGLTDVFFLFLRLALCCVEPDTPGVSEAFLDFLATALSIAELDLAISGEMRFSFEAASPPDLDLLGTPGVDSTAALGLIGVAGAESFTDFLDLTPSVLVPDLLETGVGTSVVLSDAVAISGPCFLGLSLPLKLLFVGLSFSILAFLQLLVRVSVTVHVSGLVSDPLAETVGSLAAF